MDSGEAETSIKGRKQVGTSDAIDEKRKIKFILTIIVGLVSVCNGVLNSVQDGTNTGTILVEST